MLDIDLLTRAPSAEEAWELQRSATAQLGLHALFTYALGLRVEAAAHDARRADADPGERWWCW